MARQMRMALEKIASRWSTARKLATKSGGSAAPVVSAVQQPSGSSSRGTLGKRFYEQALVKPIAAAVNDQQPDGLHEISLDHRVLRTPAKQPLRFSNPALAHAIAAEWEWQDSSGIRSFTMPLMKLAAISIDQIPKDKKRVIATLLKYSHTDALCCRASPDSVLYVDASGYEEKKAGLTAARALELHELTEGGTVLYTIEKDKQARHWDPLLDWVEGEIGARPIVSSSIFGPNQPHDVISGLEKCLGGMNDWQLAAIDSLAGAARSIIVALAIARNKLRIDEAIEIIRLEENHQVEDWGYVEGGHDIDEADIRVQIAAASVFLRLL